MEKNEKYRKRLSIYIVPVLINVVAHRLGNRWAQEISIQQLHSILPFTSNVFKTILSPSAFSLESSIASTLHNPFHYYYYFFATLSSTAFTLSFDFNSCDCDILRFFIYLFSLSLFFFFLNRSGSLRDLVCIFGFVCFSLFCQTPLTEQRFSHCHHRPLSLSKSSSSL